MVGNVHIIVLFILEWQGIGTDGQRGGGQTKGLACGALMTSLN